MPVSVFTVNKELNLQNVRAGAENACACVFLGVGGLGE
jgi:hypothetical protein